MPYAELAVVVAALAVVVGFYFAAKWYGREQERRKQAEADQTLQEKLDDVAREGRADPVHLDRDKLRPPRMGPPSS